MRFQHGHVEDMLPAWSKTRFQHDLVEDALSARLSVNEIDRHALGILGEQCAMTEGPHSDRDRVPIDRLMSRPPRETALLSCRLNFAQPRAETGLLQIGLSALGTLNGQLPLDIALHGRQRRACPQIARHIRRDNIFCYCIHPHAVRFSPD